jgi:hypothetical protein
METNQADYSYRGAGPLVALHDQYLSEFLATWKAANVRGFDLPPGRRFRLCFTRSVAGARIPVGARVSCLDLRAAGTAGPGDCPCPGTRCDRVRSGELPRQTADGVEGSASRRRSGAVLQARVCVALGRKVLRRGDDGARRYAPASSQAPVGRADGTSSARLDIHGDTDSPASTSSPEGWR